MSKQQIPMTIKARAVMEKVGGIKHLDADKLAEELKIDKKIAWSLIWQLRNNPNCGKAQNGPFSKIVNGHNGHSNGNGSSKSFIRPNSAAARMLGSISPDEPSQEERTFLAVVQLIGVQRAEELLQEFRSRLTQDIRGVSR